MNAAEPSALTILVVEDDTDLRELVLAVLASAAFVVQQAQNGLEALASVRSRMPSLILLDMKMPVMTGWEFAAQYGSEFTDCARRAPIIVMSAAEHVASRAQQIGAAGYIAKPFSPDQLVEKVRGFARR
ncbi:MAG: response regulator [Polyangiaceae bacterium]|nr:response regulator [Polyangiaceae bacterium]